MFQKTDCEVTEVGSMVEYVVEAGRFSSSVSKEDANQKALVPWRLKVQVMLMSMVHVKQIYGITWRSQKYFNKNDCEDGFIGAPYTYTVEAVNTHRRKSRRC